MTFLTVKNNVVSSCCNGDQQRRAVNHDDDSDNGTSNETKPTSPNSKDGICSKRSTKKNGNDKHHSNYRVLIHHNNPFSLWSPYLHTNVVMASSPKSKSSSLSFSPSPSPKDNHHHRGGRCYQEVPTDLYFAANETQILATSTTNRVIAPPPSATVPDGSTPAPGKRGDTTPGNSRSSSSLYSSPPPPRAYLADMKGPFEHLLPKALLLSTLRVGIQQGGTIIMGVLSDQYEYDRSLNELVEEGKLTPEQATDQSYEWEQNEWKLSAEQFPKRYGKALLRYHACTLLIRLYEHLVLYHSNIKIATVDKLTKDPAASAKRKLERATMENKGAAFSKKKSSREVHHEVAKQMFSTTLYSNAIGFLADATVQECIYIASYSMFVYHHIQQSKQKREGKGNDDNNKVSTCTLGGICLSFLVKTGALVASRFMGWICAASGSVVGTYFLPGWGTIMGTQLGDNLAGTLFEHATTSSSSGGGGNNHHNSSSFDKEDEDDDDDDEKEL